MDTSKTKPFLKPLKDGTNPRVELDMAHCVSWAADGVDPAQKDDQESTAKTKTGFGSTESGGREHPPHQSQAAQVHAFLAPTPRPRALENITEAAGVAGDLQPPHKPEPPPAAYFRLNGRVFCHFFTKSRCILKDFG